MGTYMKQIVVSFSGGRTSARFCELTKKLFPNAVYVFMDTGAEHPETYEFVKKVNTEFDLNLVCLRAVIHPDMGVGVTYKIVGIDEIKHDLEPWREMVNKYGLPYLTGAFCTDRMKTTPCRKYLIDTYGKGNYEIFLGMRIDEPSRLKPKLGIKYLADFNDSEKQDILDWWAKMPFDLKIKEHLGNCVFCIKKGINKVALAARDEPELASQFIDVITSDNVRKLPVIQMDDDLNLYEDDFDFNHLATSGLDMYRGHLSLMQIIDLYEEMPTDKLAKTVRSTFETGSCSESCELLVEQMGLEL